MSRVLVLTSLPPCARKLFPLSRARNSNRHTKNFSGVVKSTCPQTTASLAVFDGHLGRKFPEKIGRNLNYATLCDLLLFSPAARRCRVFPYLVGREDANGKGGRFVAALKFNVFQDFQPLVCGFPVRRGEQTSDGCWLFSTEACMQSACF